MRLWNCAYVCMKREGTVLRRKHTTAVSFVLFLLFGAAFSAPAQDVPTISNAPLREGDTVVVGTLNKQASKIDVEIGTKVVVPSSVTINRKKGTFRVELGGEDKLVRFKPVSVRQIVSGITSDWSSPIEVAEAECTNDCRGDFEATFYIGTVMDTFAGSQVQKFVNPDASGGIQWRGTAGTDFSYRLWGKHRPDESRRFANNLWLYGETVYGARSAQFDCAKNPTFLNCQDTPTSPPPPNEFFFILRNAATLEGFAGFQWEFLSLRPSGKSVSANLYVKSQAGFLTVSLPSSNSTSTTPSTTPSNFAQVHHIAVGGVITNGEFQDSYFEIGHGRTDLFGPSSRRRWKVDSFLTFPVDAGINFYIQLFADTDFGNASDSVQTYFGFDFDLKNVRGWFRAKSKKQ